MHQLGYLIMFRSRLRLEMSSASHKRYAASTTRPTLKFLRRNPPKIIALQAQAGSFEKYSIILMDSLLKLHYGMKPLFKTNYARYQLVNKILFFCKNNFRRI